MALVKGKGIGGEGIRQRCRILSQHSRFRELCELIRLARGCEGGVVGKGAGDPGRALLLGDTKEF